MPAFDGTGPWGAGPMTGWGAGWCATGRRPAGFGCGYGYGFGRGFRGRGRGFGPGRGLDWRRAWGPFYGGDQPAIYSPAAERSWLAAEANELKARLSEVEERLAELKEAESTQT